ncbi:SKP1-like protein [Novymonas esmeraldas]|uniref:SKP1-like protein n=1 Tax=Novymonas esmeraldas TaxID=1808958 RepID=A0AAW0ENE5_9TRYP
MAQRSPTSSVAVSALTHGGQTLILIASDGVRVPVSRAIATEASFVLRDLLDGQDLLPSSHRNGGGGGGDGGLAGDETSSPLLSTAVAVDGAIELDSLFEVAGGTSPVMGSGAHHSPHQRQPYNGATKAAAKGAVPDLMDFFPIAAAADPMSDIFGEAAAAPAPAGQATQASSPSPQLSRPASPPGRATPTTRRPPLAHTPSRPPPLPVPPPAEVEVPFPYFTGDILERVCRHMSYRFRLSSFGTEDGCYRVYVVRTRTIPRPMTLPLVEYLDVRDRSFIADWDELLTVQMVKAATLLNYEELLHLASAKLASYLIDRDLEGVRTLLGVENDFDAVEDAELKKEQAADYIR